MTVCAYCSNPKQKLTREHVINKSFLDRFYKIGKGYANDKERYTIDYSVIKDVCERCNNECLSLVDQYFLSFYEENIPLEMISTNSIVKINYDFENLSKWLLKTLYNSERKNGYKELPKKMGRYKDYIRGKDKRIALFKIYLEMLVDVPVEEIRKYSDLDTSDIDGQKLNFLRIGNEVIRSNNSKDLKCTIRHFTSSNFMFHVFILDPGQHSGTNFQKILHAYREATSVSNISYIDPDKRELEVKASNRSILDILELAFEGDKPVVDRLKEDYIKTQQKAKNENKS